MGDISNLRLLMGGSQTQARPPSMMPSPDIGGLMGQTPAGPGGLMDFNALASQLAGPMPTSQQGPPGGGPAGFMPSPVSDFPPQVVTAGNALDLIRQGYNIPYTPQSIPGLSPNQSGFNQELEAISRRAALAAQRSRNEQ
jgi:hypothetical protein